MKHRALLCCLLASLSVLSARHSGSAQNPEIFEPARNVFLEGEQDFDGDGRIGSAEDGDGNDGVFGTVAMALGEAGVRRNWGVTIVTSGRFREPLRFDYSVMDLSSRPAVTVQAAPGVQAIIDGGDFGGTVIGAADSGADFGATKVTLRNLEIRGWVHGINVPRGGQVTLEGCRVEQNSSTGLAVQPGGLVVVKNTTFTANSSANEGSAFQVAAGARAVLIGSLIVGNFGDGVKGSRSEFQLIGTVVSGNRRNFVR